MTKHYLQKSLKKGKENIDKQWESCILVWIQSKMVWRLIIVNRIILLLENLLLWRCLTYSPSKRSVTSSPPPPQPQLNIGGKEAFNAIFKYQGNNTAELEIFPVCLGISPLSYFSTAIILYQHVYLISARSMKKRFGHFGNKMTHFQMKFT